MATRPTTTELAHRSQINTEPWMTSKRDVIKAAIAHEDVGEVPYFINFTHDAEETIAPHYPGPDL